MIRFLGLLCLLFGMYLLWTVRFRHPELTETQLFLQFGQVWGGAIIAIAFGMWCLVRGEK